ncbi:hypothetical protein BU16DRAFT_79669 [Lophium mytilinum]|uniref:Uncharacterized protein n=1 Tax=Lophium mytilinum TaxID=390894 RepID=A0A6A6QMS4_9PEZI|nr:hypothetical protein BU16DRAFT_79669 [Lophium mytilinum]
MQCSIPAVTIWQAAGQPSPPWRPGHIANPRRSGHSLMKSLLIRWWRIFSLGWPSRRATSFVKFPLDLFQLLPPDVHAASPSGPNIMDRVIYSVPDPCLQVR